MAVGWLKKNLKKIRRRPPRVPGVTRTLCRVTCLVHPCMLGTPMHAWYPHRHALPFPIRTIGSIQRGVQALTPDCTTVIVHDAVRPFVDAATLRAVTEAARDHGASGTTVPLVSTVIKVNNEGFMEHSLDRSAYRASQTPQAFRRDVIVRMYERCTDHDLDHGTECLHLAQTYGGSRVKLVEGVAANLWKVTHQHDLFAAEQMVKKKLRQVQIDPKTSEGGCHPRVCRAAKLLLLLLFLGAGVCWIVCCAGWGT